jgi:tRNA/tmRNA/rRNA uracil-C5-methylase (TrmA/RlmC/RlmD family)
MNSATEVVWAERMIQGGWVLARLDRQVLLLRGALPGERVAVRLLGQVGGALRAETVEILEASPERLGVQEAGSADLSHLSYPGQLACKREIVQDALRRIAKLETHVPLPVSSPRQWGYRNGAQYQITAQGAAYFEPGSHRPVPVRTDPLVMPELQATLERFPVGSSSPPGTVLALRSSWHSREVLGRLIGGSPEQAAEWALQLGLRGMSQATNRQGPVLWRWGKTSTLERYGSLLLSVGADSFAQINPAAMQPLFADLLDLAGTGDRAADLYGGSGAIGLHLSDRFGAVEVVESNPASVALGKQDAARLGKKINFRCARSDRVGLGADLDLVVVDPPRSGLDQPTRQALSSALPRRLLYLSCDPATWARDIRALRGAGMELVWLQPYDLFPQTHHVEVLSLLTRST